MTLYSQCLICGEGIPIYYENGVPHAKGRLVNGYRLCPLCCTGVRTRDLEAYVNRHIEKMNGLVEEYYKERMEEYATRNL